MLLLAYSQMVGVPNLLARDPFDPGDRLLDRVLRGDPPRSRFDGSPSPKSLLNEPVLSPLVG
jgi:hypothetical protein